MIETLKQVDLANALHISEMSVSRIMKAFGRNNPHLSDADVIKCLAIGELVKLGFTLSSGTDLLVETDSEIRYLMTYPDRRCWIVYVEREGRRFSLSALNHRYLEALLDSFGLTRVLPLHRIVECAQEQFDCLTAEKARRVAA